MFLTFLTFLMSLFAGCTGTGIIAVDKDPDPCDLDLDDPSCAAAVYPWYRDADGDGYGENGRPIMDERSPGSTDTAAAGSWVTIDGDCNDNDPTVRPGIPEVCNGADDDCNTLVDEGGACQLVDTGQPTDTDPPIETDLVIDTDHTDDTDRSDTDSPIIIDTADTADSGHTDDTDSPPPLETSSPDETDEPVETDLVIDTDRSDTDSPIIIDTADTADSGHTDHTDDTDSPIIIDTVDTADSGHTDDTDSPPPLETSSPDETDEPVETDPPIETDLVIDTDHTDDTDSPPPLETSSPDETDEPVETDPPLDTFVTVPQDTSVSDTADDSDVIVDTDGRVFRNWYRDADGDGAGAGAPIYSETAPLGHVANDNDCDDGNPGVNPGATEVCNDVDDDCDGTVDDGLSRRQWYRDADSDGYGSDVVESCQFGQPAGLVRTSGDCNDGDGAISPGATEVCNSIDDDCDGSIDAADGSAQGLAPAYYDYDGDRFGDGGIVRQWCSGELLPMRYSWLNGDCNDEDHHVFPGDVAYDVCGDGVDQNCDGLADNNPAGALQWYTDLDADGFGTPAFTTTACGVPSWPQTARQLGDCNDSVAAINPGVEEVCDFFNVDENCDGRADDDDDFRIAPESLGIYYLDNDGDGYAGDEEVLACDPDPAADRYTINDDCDDGDATFNPAAPEWDDPIDWNCDGSPWRELISTTATGQQVQWSGRPIGNAEIVAGDWGTSNPANFSVNVVNMPQGWSLPPGPITFLAQSGASTSTQSCPNNFVTKSVALPNDGQTYAVGLVHQFTNPGQSTPVVMWDNTRISNGQGYGAGIWTAFAAYGTFVGDGQQHILKVCEGQNASGFRLAMAGIYPVFAQ